MINTYKVWTEFVTRLQISIVQFLNMYIVINEHSVVVKTDNGVMLVDELQLSSEQ